MGKAKEAVFHLSKYYFPFKGGLESVVSDIAENCKIYDCFVLASDTCKLPNSEVINSVTVIRSREFFAVASTSFSPAYIFHCVKRISGSIVHVHYPNPLASLALFFSWLCGADISRLVVHWHSDIVKQSVLLKLYRPLLNWSLRRSKVIIVTSPCYLDHSNQLKEFKNKCSIVPIGIPSLDCSVDFEVVQAVKNRFGYRKIVFALGRHIYYKGFEYLIEAASELDDDCVVLIGGSGPDTKKYKNLIERLGLSEKVLLLGRVEDVDLASFYKAADVFCLPSIEKSEAFGVVQLEAMSVGTPVVSTNIMGSGVPWVNRHEVSGLICEPRSSEMLGRTLHRILSDDGLRERLSLGAKDRYEALFTERNMIEKIEDIYGELPDYR